MINIKSDKFRLTNITNLFTGERPESEGLALEVEDSSGDNYYVIACLYWDAKELTTYMETIGTRFEEAIEPEDWPWVRNLIELGSDIIRTANKDYD